jgi:hypothetical protein
VSHRPRGWTPGASSTGATVTTSTNTAMTTPRAATCPPPLPGRRGVPGRRDRRSWTMPAPASWCTGRTRRRGGAQPAAARVRARRRRPRRACWPGPGRGTRCRSPVPWTGRPAGNRPGVRAGGSPGWSGVCRGRLVRCLSWPVGPVPVVGGCGDVPAAVTRHANPVRSRVRVPGKLKSAERPRHTKLTAGHQRRHPMSLIIEQY